MVLRIPHFSNYIHTINKITHVFLLLRTPLGYHGKNVIFPVNCWSQPEVLHDPRGEDRAELPRWMALSLEEFRGVHSRSEKIGENRHIWCFTMVFLLHFSVFFCENGGLGYPGYPSCPAFFVWLAVLTQLTRLGEMSNLPRPQFSIVLSGDSSSASNSKILWEFSLALA